MRIHCLTSLVPLAIAYPVPNWTAGSPGYLSSYQMKNSPSSVRVTGGKEQPVTPDSPWASTEYCIRGEVHDR